MNSLSFSSYFAFFSPSPFPSPFPSLLPSPLPSPLFFPLSSHLSSPFPLSFPLFLPFSIPFSLSLQLFFLLSLFFSLPIGIIPNYTLNLEILLHDFMVVICHRRFVCFSMIPLASYISFPILFNIMLNTCTVIDV